MSDPFTAPGADDLYALDPAEFTEARNTLATEVKKSGDRETAEQIKRLSKPTVVAWAVNQVARRHPDKVEELLQLGERVRGAQAAVLEGGDPSALRDATSARRSLVRELAALASEIAGENHRQEAAATIEAAAAGGEAGAALRAGRLTRALEPESGFGIDGLADPPPDAQSRRPDRRVLRRLEQEVESTEAAVSDARERLARAEERLDQARESFERAKGDAEAAEAEHAAAVEALEKAQS